MSKASVPDVAAVLKLLEGAPNAQLGPTERLIYLLVAGGHQAASLTELATLVGRHRNAVSRALKTLDAAGLVHTLQEANGAAELRLTHTPVTIRAGVSTPRTESSKAPHGTQQGVVGEGKVETPPPARNAARPRTERSKGTRASPYKGVRTTTRSSEERFAEALSGKDPNDEHAARALFRQLRGESFTTWPKVAGDLVRWYRDHGPAFIRSASEEANTQARQQGSPPANYLFVDYLDGSRPLPTALQQDNRPRLPDWSVGDLVSAPDGLTGKVREVTGAWVVLEDDRILRRADVRPAHLN